MKVKMMIVAVIAMGAQFASATAPSAGCALNANKQPPGVKSPEQATKEINGLMQIASAQDHQTAPANGKK